MELAVRLRTATADAHERAEQSVVMRRLIGGDIDRAAYIALLSNLRALYAALESGLARHAGHAAIAPITFPALARLAALDEDLQFWDADGVVRLVVDATNRYVARLRQLADEQPHRLVAHAYVRYLGDLSGGQMLAKSVARALQLRNGVGLAFYRFNVGDIGAFKQRYRAALNALPLDELMQSEIVDEAVQAFAWHEQMFAELASV